MLACEFRVTDDGIGIDIRESRRLSHATAFDDMFDDGNHFFFRQARVEKDRSTIFGKALIATAAPQQSGVVGTVGVPNTDIFGSANAELGALFIRAAKLIEVVIDRVHGVHIL